MILERLNRASGQNTLLGVIALCVPGIFLALNGLGAGGLDDLTISSNALTALYATCSVTGALVSGIINNTLGHRLTIFLSILTFIIYLGSIWSYHIIKSSLLVIATGSLLGFGTCTFWTAQGSIVMSYPSEHEKGKFFCLFWTLYTGGAMIGGFISFYLNFSNETKEVSVSTYTSFMILMVIGLFLSLLFIPIKRVIRSDGSPVEVPGIGSFSEHLKGLRDVYTDWRLLTLIPLFMTSNFYYSYEFNTFNGTLFNVRTRCLNNGLYWIMEILPAPFWSKLLDCPSMSRKKRGFYAVSIVATVLTLVWGSGYFIQRTYSNTSPPVPLDFTDPNYIGYLCVFLGFGLCDFLVQSTCFWLMGLLSNDPYVLAQYAGYFTSVQAVGSAIAWQINAIGIPFMSEYLVNISMLFVSLICALIVISRLSEPIYPESDSKECIEIIKA